VVKNHDKTLAEASLVNLAFSMAMDTSYPRRRVGILDLDIFGPSIPTLMGLEKYQEPHLTESEFCCLSRSQLLI
jgi:Mrp family chromosome partitioning ATPase